MLERQSLSLVDAIVVAIEAERKAAAFYANSVLKTGNPIGKRLFGQLSDFEELHVRGLSSLRSSLLDGGEIVYEGGQLNILAPEDMLGAVEPDRLSVMAILELAIELEHLAEHRYAALSTQTSHPGGRAIFEKLAAEEQSHYLLLERAYGALNGRGEWDWLSQPPRGKSGRQLRS